MKFLWEVFEKIVRKIMSVLLGLFNKEWTEEQWQSFFQFVKFCLVGVSNTAISLGIYYIFLMIVPNLYIIGNAVGFIVSVLNSYFWNSKFVFDKKDEKGKTIVKTFVAYSTNLLLGTMLLYVFVDILHISEYLAPLLNLVITVPLNYVLNKKWVMKK